MTTSKPAMSEKELKEFEESYRRLLGFVSPRIRSRLAKGAEIDPELVRMQERLREHAMFPACFDTKTAQLMLFGMLLVLDSDAARIHGWAAFRAGATWEELHAVAGLAFLYRGVPAMNLAGEVWQFIEEQAGK
jgi:4-carboxymuconolactone decarboxylase